MLGLRPFFTYYGGKWRSAPRYPKPVYDTIVEPFAGSAGYALRYYERNVILVEKYDALAALWAYLVKATQRDFLSLPDLLPDQSVDDLKVSSEAKTLIGFWLNKGTAAPCKTPSAWMRVGTHPTSFWGPAIRHRLAEQAGKIRHWRVIRGDYTDAPDKQATWFVDPPYQSAGKLYKHSSDYIDYDQLAVWCRIRKGQVMVCENVGAGWLPFKPYLLSKSSPSSRGYKYSNECLWINQNVIGRDATGG